MIARASSLFYPSVSSSPDFGRGPRSQNAAHFDVISGSTFQLSTFNLQLSTSSLRLFVSPSLGRTHTQRRGFVLLAVVVIAGASLFLASALIAMMKSDAAVAAGARESQQSRALAWSGLQVVMSELDRQREEILDGRTPRIENEYVIYESASGAGVVRLLPFGVGDERLVPETGKLDLNTIDADALERTGLVAPAIAQAIIDHRDEVLQRPYQSVAELLDVEGVTAEMLYGPLEEMAKIDAVSPQRDDREERILSRLSSGGVRGLADILTVYSFEPAIQRNGRLRMNFNVKWSEELARRVRDRFGSEAVQTVKGLFDAGPTFKSDAGIVRHLIRSGVDPQQWVEPIDAFTTETGEFHGGRLDLNTAPYEALLGLPGIEPGQAAQIVRIRERLADEDRATVAWPAIEGILEPQQYEVLGGRITMRCWTYRVRIAAGVVDFDDPDERMEHAAVYEAVIDLAAPTPRLAYLREISLLGATAAIALESDADGRDDLENGFFSRRSTAESTEGDDLQRPAMRDEDNGEGADAPEEDSDDDGANSFGMNDSNREATERAESVGPLDSGAEDTQTESEDGAAPRRMGRWKRGD